MKGIVLAGGTGSRLYPLTEFVGKQLLPVYDKPMIYYPISTLMLAGIKDVMIISTPKDCPVIERALGDGSIWGISISYCIQESPDGIAQAFILAEDFIDGDNSVLVLGDNIFYGHGLPGLLDNAASRNTGATVFGYCVSDPERFGVVEFDHAGRVLSLEEKPQSPRSNFAVTGLYFYDNSVCDVAKDLRPSSRGELEITDLNLHYLRSSELHCEVLGRGYAWLDAGTHDSLLESSSFVAALQKRQGLLVCSPEEIAFRKNWISAEDLERTAVGLGKTSYGEYLLRLATEA